MSVSEQEGNESALALHASDCITWELPEPDPDLVLTAFDDEAVGTYALEVRPVYERLKRVLGQLSGLLILAQTAPARADRDQPMVTTAREQLDEVQELWNGIRPPAAASRHHAAVGRIHEQLGMVARDLDRRINLSDANSHELDRLMKRLFAAHALLLAVSDDRAEMTPVDFSHACCTCGADGQQRQVGKT